MRKLAFCAKQQKFKIWFWAIIQYCRKGWTISYGNNMFNKGMWIIQKELYLVLLENGLNIDYKILPSQIIDQTIADTSYWICWKFFGVLLIKPATRFALQAAKELWKNSEFNGILSWNSIRSGSVGTQLNKRCEGKSSWKL